MKKRDGIGLIVLLAIFVLAVSSLRASIHIPERETERAFGILLSDDSLSLLSRGEIDEERLHTLSQKSYAEVKEEIGISRDFCIYFEDLEGGLIPLDEELSGIGSDQILINQKPCRW